MRIRRAPVVWKKDHARVVIMAKTGVFLLNKKASSLWESFNKGETNTDGSEKFIDTLLKERLVEVEND